MAIGVLSSDPSTSYVGGASGYVSPITGFATAADSNLLQGNPASYFQVNLGFTYAATPTVTGSRGGNAALASLLTALAAQNIIINSTTA